MREKDTAKLAWELFKKTGQIGYYNLYTKLNKKKK